MTASLPAAQCPAVQVASVSILRNTGLDTSAVVAPNVPANVNWRKQANQIGTILDQTGRYGGGVYGVPDGPTKILLTAPATGLLLNVSAGHGMIGGPVELAAASTVAVPDNTSRVWIWLLQTGAAVLPETTLAPPAGECVLLGSCSTQAGNIVGLDTSGVMYLRGGVGWRQSADAAAPGDTPPSSVQFLAYTLGGAFWWDGTVYSQMASALALAAVSTAAGDASNRLDVLERKFRALLLGLVMTIGEEPLICDELRDDLDTATLEA